MTEQEYEAALAELKSQDIETTARYRKALADFDSNNPNPQLLDFSVYYDADYINFGRI